MDNNIDPWELLRELRKHFGSEGGVPYHLWHETDAALAAHESEMIEHKKNFARDCKDFDRTMAAWKNG